MSPHPKSAIANISRNGGECQGFDHGALEGYTGHPVLSRPLETALFLQRRHCHAAALTLLQRAVWARLLEWRHTYSARTISATKNFWIRSAMLPFNYSA